MNKTCCQCKKIVEIKKLAQDKMRCLECKTNNDLRKAKIVKLRKQKEAEK